MANIQDVLKWAKRDLDRYGKDTIEVDMNYGIVGGDEYLKFYVYTDNNKYAIVANTKNENGYLGCVASSRKKRAGENWYRGNDLPDGELNEQTWNNIVSGIISYELVKIHRKDNRKNIADSIHPEGAKE